MAKKHLLEEPLKNSADILVPWLKAIAVAASPCLGAFLSLLYAGWITTGYSDGSWRQSALMQRFGPPDSIWWTLPLYMSYGFAIFGIGSAILAHRRRNWHQVWAGSGCALCSPLPWLFFTVASY
ncbi:MAG: hypothetical protein ABL949_16025 [Fimbriimonadaceae bacterium]